MDYAIYLVKRTLHKRQKYGLEEYEQCALHKLQNVLAQKWEFICMQAADQMRLYKDKRKSDQIVLEAQERAFWRVHRPPPTRLSCFEERLPRNRDANKRPLSWRRAHACILLNKFIGRCPEQSASKNQQTRPQPRQPNPTTLPHSHLRLSNKKSIENLLLFTANRVSYDWFLGEIVCGGGLSASSSLASASPWLNQPSSIEMKPCRPLVGLPTCDSILASSPLGSCLSIDVNVEAYTEALGNPSMLYPTVNQVRHAKLK